MVEVNALTEPEPGSDIGRDHVVADAPLGTDPGSARSGAGDTLGPFGVAACDVLAVR